MANGNGGFTFVTGTHVSTGAIILGGIVIVTGLWLLTRRMEEQAIIATPEVRVLNDIYRASAYPAQISQNHDRIMAAIQRIRDQWRVAREAFQKKLRDLRLARIKGTITLEQYRAQRRIAINEFHTAIRLRHREIMDQLKVPARNENNNRPPTVP